VLAAVLASLKDTEDGSLRNEDAVFNAACFSANVVPWLGASGLGEDVEDIREKRDCSSLSCVLATGEAVGAELSVGDRDGGGNGCLDFAPLMPNPGTDTPAAPSLFKAP